MKRKLIEKLSRSAEQNIQPKTERKQLTQPATAEQANQANNDVLFTFLSVNGLKSSEKPPNRLHSKNTSAYAGTISKRRLKE